MTTITIEMKPFVLASDRGEAYSHAVDPKAWTPAYVVYLCEYAAGVIVQRATAPLSDKQGGTVEERAKAREAAVQKILDGTIGRTASGMSREDAALRDALEAQKWTFLRIPTGEKTDKGNAKTKAEPVSAAFARFVAHLAEKSGKPVDAETTEAVLKKLQDTVAYKTAMGSIDPKISL